MKNKRFFVTRTIARTTTLAVCVLMLAVGALFFASPSLAERLVSESYVIQFGNFNMGAGKREGTLYNVSYTLGQTAAGPYGDYGSTGSTYSVSYTHLTLPTKRIV